MIVPWIAQPSPDGVKPASWRIRLLVRLASHEGISHAGFLDSILDTGAHWTTFTEDHAPAAGIDDITTGPATSVQWLGVNHAAWLHRLRLTIAIDPRQSDTVTPDAFDVLFIRRFPHARTKKLLSFAVLGMDCLRHLQLTLDGPAAATRF